MQQQKTTFDELPGLVSELLSKVQRLEDLILLGSMPGTQKPLPDVIGIDEACQMLGLSKSTTYAKISKKEIPFIKVKNSNRVLFSRKSLNAWLMDGLNHAA